MRAIIRRFHTDRFTVTVSAWPEDDLDLSFDEDGSVKAALDGGSLEAFRVEASVLFRGVEVGVDHLGGCIYESPAKFMDHLGIKRHVPPGGKAGQCGSYFSDMVREAIAEARKTLAKMGKANLRK